MPPVLRIDSLWKSYAAGVRGCSIRAWVLRGCNLHVALGERVAIVGAAASGKSTLLRCIAGELRADAGHLERLVPVVRPATSRPVLRANAAIYLIDDEPDALAHLRFGGTAIVACREVARIRKVVDRIMLLRDGRLTPLTHVAVRRVAERAPVAASEWHRLASTDGPRNDPAGYHDDITPAALTR